MKWSKTLLSTAYFGPVEYFARLTQSESVWIEKYEHYPKQTYRNRCVIMGANGAQSLVVPVKRPQGNKTLVKDVRVDYDMDWQKNHLKSIESAYKNSAFYEFYIDEFYAIFTKKFEFLIDMNTEISSIALGHLEYEVNIEFSNHFIENSEGYQDYRTCIHPKKSMSLDTQFKAPEYIQVFSQKLGFIPNLSILDLIFNTGPETASLLRKSIVK